MKVTDICRSWEPCREADYVGFVLHFDGAVDTRHVEALGEIASLCFLQTLRRPYYILRGEGFLLRGQTGDSFCRLGIRDGDGALLETVRCQIESVLSRE